MQLCPRQVSILLRGAKGKMKSKKKLTNAPLGKAKSKTNSGLPEVKFGRGSTKTFKVKAPDVGELKSLTIEVSHYSL